MSYTTSGPVEVILEKVDTVDPAVGNDNTQGYAIKSRWINTSSNEEWVCTDASTGAASWELTTGGDGDVLSDGTTAQDAVLLTERADHVNTPAAGKAEIWVSDDDPGLVQRLVFTDDVGDDREVLTLAAATGTTAGRVPFMADTGVALLETDSLFFYIKADDQLRLEGNANLALGESSSAPTAVDGRGYLWVKDDAPTTLIYTDDAGTDKALTFTEGAISDTSVPRIRTDGHLETDADHTYSTGELRLSKLSGGGSGASLRIRERDTAPANSAGYGNIWVKDDVPTVLMFTDDDAGDKPIVTGPASATDQGFARYNGTSGNILQNTSSLTFGSGHLTNTSGTAAIVMQERSGAPANTANFGKIWVKDDVPTVLMFTDDDAGDKPVVTGPASATANGLVRWSGTSGNIVANSSGITFSSGNLNFTGATSSITMTERTTGPSTPSDGGKFWVRDDVPSAPMFTDDTGGESRLNKELDITLASNELIDVDATEVVIGGGYLDGSTGGTYSWEILGTYNDNGGTGNQDLDVFLYDRGPDGTPVAGVLRSTISIDTVDTLDRVSQALTVAASPGTDADEIDSDEPRLYEVRAKLDAGGGVDTARILSVRFIES